MMNKIHVLTDNNIIAIFYIISYKYKLNIDQIAIFSNAFRDVLNNEESIINDITDIIERIDNED